MVTSLSVPKLTLAESALDAIIELDRAVHHLDAESSVVQMLGQQLLVTSAPSGGVARRALVDANYFRPWERLYQERQSRAAESVTEIQDFVRDSAERLMSFQGKESSESIDQLLAFCKALHQQLIEDLRGESQIVRNRRPEERGTEVGICAA